VHPKGQVKRPTGGSDRDDTHHTFSQPPKGRRKSQDRRQKPSKSKEPKRRQIAVRKKTKTADGGKKGAGGPRIQGTVNKDLELAHGLVTGQPRYSWGSIVKGVVISCNRQQDGTDLKKRPEKILSSGDFPS